MVVRPIFPAPAGLFVEVQMTLGRGGKTGGGKGRGISAITKPNASTMRIEFDDGTPSVDVPLPAGTVGKPGNYVGANPAATGPVLIIQGGAYVTAAPSMLAALTAQLYLKGTDGLYADGLVPFVWPAGVSAGWRLFLQVQTGGSNLLWLAPGAEIPATLGTATAALVELGTTGQVQDTVIWKKDRVYFDNTAVLTSDRFLAATYANVAAFETVYTKFGTFATFLYDDAGTPVSGRLLEINPGQTVGLYGYLRNSYPTGSATFAKGSCVVMSKKGGGTGELVAILQASGSGATYTAIEARLDTGNKTLRLYSVVNGAANPIGAAVAKGTAGNDVQWYVRLYVESGIVRARAWAQNVAEPSTWDLDTTQTTITTAGLAGFRTNFDYMRAGFFGVSRGDANAPIS